MAHKYKNYFRFDLNEECFYKKDNSKISIFRKYHDYLERNNIPSYFVIHLKTGEKFNLLDYQISHSEIQKFNKSPFRELDFVYHIPPKPSGQPKCYEIISITEEENGYLNHHCRELYTQNFEDFSQNQLSYRADVVCRISEDMMWR
jgi:hypothetical protein